MPSDLRIHRLFGLGVAIALVAAGGAGCASFGTEASAPDTEEPPVGADGSGEPEAKPPEKSGSTDAPPPRVDVVDFGAVECNAVVPPRALLTPSAPTSSAWNTTLDGTSFAAKPASGTLEKGQSARFDVITAMIANIKSVEPITSKLTIALLDAADRNQVISLRVQPKGAILGFDADNLTFDTIPAVATPPKTVKVSNSGNATVTFTIAADNNAFTITPATVTLQPKELKPLTVRYVRQGIATGKAVVTATTGAVCFTAPLSFTATIL